MVTQKSVVINFTLNMMSGTLTSVPTRSGDLVNAQAVK